MDAHCLDKIFYAIENNLPFLSKSSLSGILLTLHILIMSLYSLSLSRLNSSTMSAVWPPSVEGALWSSIARSPVLMTGETESVSRHDCSRLLRREPPGYNRVMDSHYTMKSTCRCSLYLVCLFKSTTAHY